VDKEEVAVLVVLVRRNCCAVGAGVRRAVANEVSGAAEKETGPAAVRRVPPGLLGALPVHALGVLDIIVVVRDDFKPDDFRILSLMPVAQDSASSCG